MLGAWGQGGDGVREVKWEAAVKGSDPARTRRQSACSVMPALRASTDSTQMMTQLVLSCALQGGVTCEATIQLSVKDIFTSGSSSL